MFKTVTEALITNWKNIFFANSLINENRNIVKLENEIPADENFAATIKQILDQRSIQNPANCPFFKSLERINQHFTPQSLPPTFILRNTWQEHKLIKANLFPPSCNAQLTWTCSFVACPIMYLCAGSCTAHSTTSNCSDEKATTTKALGTFSTRTCGFRRTTRTQTPRRRRLRNQQGSEERRSNYIHATTCSDIAADSFQCLACCFCKVFFCVRAHLMETVTSWKRLFNNMVESPSKGRPADQISHCDKLWLMNE